MSEPKKYYWLKLKKDFFKKHDIRIVEDMENGKDYVLVYLKLLVESIAHEGSLRFSDTIPYNDKMIATITNTNIDIVRSALKIFAELKMIDILDDDTIYMNQIKEMIGEETEWAKNKRLYREKQKLIETSKGQKKTMSDKSIELEKELEKDIYPQLLEYWNKYNIYNHKLNTFLNSLQKKHKDKIKTYGIDIAKQAIHNYSEVYKSDKYYFSHKYTLCDFITRKLEYFIDEAEPFKNFVDFKYKDKPKQITTDNKNKDYSEGW